VVLAPCPHLRTFTTKEIVKDRVIETALRSITVQNLPCVTDMSMQRDLYFIST
jgi:hypothetical protein